MNVAGMSTVGLLTVHLIPLSTDHELSHGAARIALELISGVSVLARIRCGLVPETIGWKRIRGVSLRRSGVAGELLPCSSHGWLFVAVVVFYGVCHGAHAVVVLAVVAQLFRMRSVGQLTVILVAVSQIAAATAVLGRIGGPWEVVE